MDFNDAVRQLVGEFGIPVEDAEAAMEHVADFVSRGKEWRDVGPDDVDAGRALAFAMIRRRVAVYRVYDADSKGLGA